MASWVEIAAALVIEVEHEYTPYTDETGTTSSFYRHRYRKPSAGAYSDYSAAYQVGDSLPEQWIKKDIPDAAVTAEWDRWIDQAIIDVFAEGVWFETTATVTPVVEGTTNILKEKYELPAALREVFQVELVDVGAPNRHVEWLNAEEWAQEFRTLRIYDPDDSFKYVAHGLGQYTRLGELTNDSWNLICWMLRRAYLDYTIDAIRANFRKYVMASPTSDVNVEQLERMRARSDAEVRRRAASIAPRAMGYAAS